MKNAHIDMNTTAYTSLKSAIRTAMNYSWRYSDSSDSRLDSDADWMTYNVACKVSANGEIAEWYGMDSFNGAPSFYLKATDGTFFRVYTDCAGRFMVRKARSDKFVRYDCTNTFSSQFVLFMEREDAKAAEAEATTETAEATEETTAEAAEAETAETTTEAETTESTNTAADQVSFLKSEYMEGRLNRGTYYDLLDELITIDEALQRGLVTEEFAETYRALPSEEPTAEAEAASSTIATANSCDCSKCCKTNCPHRDSFRRLPVSVGGLGLCSGMVTASEDPPITYDQFRKIVIDEDCGDIAFYWGPGEFQAYQDEYGPITRTVTKEIIRQFEAEEI